MFYYPRRGYGQITNAYAAAAQQLGADMLLNTNVERLQAPTSADGRWQVQVSQQGTTRVLDADYVWSTIPITMLARLTSPPPPPELSGPTPGIDYRAMLLVYLQLDVDRFTSTDAHYFPESSISITRLSEPKNYSDLATPAGSTVLCAELPCAFKGEVWSMRDTDLLDLFRRDIEQAGLGLLPPVAGVHVERLPHAYPMYTEGYRAAFDALDAWASSIDGLVTFGRQGLFVHDNTHHTMAMAYALADCLQPSGALDRTAWAAARKSFESNVVED
jgi:protoporphyrinogen oxidase